MAIAIQPLEQFTIERLIPLHIGRLDISYTISATDCHRPGTQAALRVANTVSAVISPTATVIIRAEFV